MAAASLRAALVRLESHVHTLRRRLAEAGVERSFFLCSTPRTGSTMLGNLLAETGLVGRAGEYFGEVFQRDVVPEMSRARFDDYLVDCARHARGTGVLGVKLHWDQVAVFLYLLRLRRGVRTLDERRLLEAVFPEPRYVWLTREDEIAQAVSWWKAMTSGKWTDGRPVTGDQRFDFAGIDSRVRRIEEHNAAWGEWFERNGIDPLAVTYEKLAADPGGVVRRVLDLVGADVPAGFTVTPRTERQADDVNADWIRRYREQARAR